MSDPIFEPEAAPPPKRPLPTALWVGLGCGVLFLASLGTCAGLGLYGAHKMVSGSRAEWTDFVEVANHLGSDATTAAEYRTHPALSQAYPTEKDFVGAVRLWRPHLGPVPTQMPSMFGGGLTYQASYKNGSSHVVIGYHLPSHAMLVGTWTNHKLSDLQLEQ